MEVPALPRHVEVPFLDRGPINFTAMVQSVKVGLTKQVSTSSIVSEAVTQPVFKYVPLHAGGKAEVLINLETIRQKPGRRHENRIFVCQSSHSSH